MNRRNFLTGVAATLLVGSSTKIAIEPATKTKNTFHTAQWCTNGTVFYGVVTPEIAQKAGLNFRSMSLGVDAPCIFEDEAGNVVVGATVKSQDDIEFAHAQYLRGGVPLKAIHFSPRDLSAYNKMIYAKYRVVILSS